jgi:hypothetical protein
MVSRGMVIGFYGVLSWGRISIFCYNYLLDKDFGLLFSGTIRVSLWIVCSFYIRIKLPVGFFDYSFPPLTDFYGSFGEVYALLNSSFTPFLLEVAGFKGAGPLFESG